MRKALTHSPQVALKWIRSARTPPDNLIIPRSVGHGPGCWTFNCSKSAAKVVALTAKAAELRAIADSHWDPGAQIALEQEALTAEQAAKELQDKIDRCCG